MASPSQKPPASQRSPQAVPPPAVPPVAVPLTAPQNQVARSRKPSGQGAAASWISELKLFGDWAGAALGNAYARAASSVLNEVERFEDRSAERRFHRRSRAGAASGASAPRLTPASKKEPLIRQGSS